MKNKTQQTEEENRIRFRDLSNPLKIAIISGWIVGTLYVLTFLAGFIIGVLS